MFYCFTVPNWNKVFLFLLLFFSLYNKTGDFPHFPLPKSTCRTCTWCLSMCLQFVQLTHFARNNNGSKITDWSFQMQFSHWKSVSYFFHWNMFFVCVCVMRSHHWSGPTDTQRNNNVIITSKRNGGLKVLTTIVDRSHTVSIIQNHTVWQYCKTAF